MASSVQAPPPMQPTSATKTTAFRGRSGGADPSGRRASAHYHARAAPRAASALVRNLLARPDHSLGSDQAGRVSASPERRHAPCGDWRRGSRAADFPDYFRLVGNSGFALQLGRDPRPHQSGRRRSGTVSDTTTVSTINSSRIFRAGGSLRITNDRGAVNLTVSDDNQIHVAAHKRINADSQAEADKFNPATKPQLNATGNVITLNANTHGRRRSRGNNRYGCQRPTQGSGCNFDAARRRQRAGPRRRR